MPTHTTLRLSRPLKAATLVSGDGVEARPQPDAARPGADEYAAAVESLQTQKQAYERAGRLLQEAAAQANALNEMIAAHHEAIARLSVEIARKILMRNVSDGDYEIESIIRETLKEIPDGAGIVVRLNPQDLKHLEALQNPALLPPGVRLTADPRIGRAECVIESPKGTVEYVIDEHLEKIQKALEKTG